MSGILFNPSISGALRHQQPEETETAQCHETLQGIPSYEITRSPFLSMAATTSLSRSLAFLRGWSIFLKPFCKPFISNAPLPCGSKLFQSASILAFREFCDSGRSISFSESDFVLWAGHGEGTEQKTNYRSPASCYHRCERRSWSATVAEFNWKLEEIELFQQQSSGFQLDVDPLSSQAGP